MTKIQWTEDTWNPVQGCFKVSPGCKNCYAIRQVARMQGNPNQKIAKRYFRIVEPSVMNWTGNVGIDKQVLLQPLKRRKPTTYFISLSDLFYTARPDEDIDRVFAVMALCPQHKFQILTKYPERMLQWFTERSGTYNETAQIRVMKYAGEIASYWENSDEWDYVLDRTPWPLPMVQLGVSVENQQYADERIPLLLRTPAALRFVSYEPALGPVDFGKWLTVTRQRDRMLDWIIVGGESGPGARPFDIEWARSTVRQCRAAGVPCFVKQLGAKPLDSKMVDIMGPDNKVHYRRPPGDPMITEQVPKAKGYWARASFIRLVDKKGGDMSAWPEDLRVREMPTA